MPQSLAQQVAASQQLVGHLPRRQQVELAVRMGMGPYLYPGSLEAGKVRGPQHVGRREHTSLISLAEGTRRHVEGAWQLPFGEGRHRVAGEVSEAVIRRDQDRADRERPVPAQAVGELRDGD